MVFNYVLFNVFINFIVFHSFNIKNDINYPVKKNSLIHAVIASLGGGLYLLDLISVVLMLYLFYPVYLID